MAEAAHAFLSSSGGRITAESNLHVTLAFLGSVAERRVEEVVAIARRVAAAGGATPPLQFSFERLEYWKRAQVLCAVPAGRPQAAANDGAAVPPGMTRDATHAASVLAAALKADLVAAGFTPDLVAPEAEIESLVGAIREHLSSKEHSS